MVHHTDGPLTRIGRGRGPLSLAGTFALLEEIRINKRFVACKRRTCAYLRKPAGSRYLPPEPSAPRRPPPLALLVGCEDQIVCDNKKKIRCGRPARTAGVEKLRTMCRKKQHAQSLEETKPRNTRPSCSSPAPAWICLRMRLGRSPRTTRPPRSLPRKNTYKHRNTTRSRYNHSRRGCDEVCTFL